jgi:hypothetical protein
MEEGLHDLEVAFLLPVACFGQKITNPTSSQARNLLRVKNLEFSSPSISVGVIYYRGE